MIGVFAPYLHADGVRDLYPKPDYYPAGRQPEQVVIADMDQDGRPDVVVANRFSDDVGVYLNRGDGDLSSPTSYAASEYAISVAAGDFNNDDFPDVVTLTDSVSPTVSVLMNQGDGTLGAPTEVLVGSGIEGNWVLVDDFDMDGNADIVVTISVNPDGVRLLKGNGDGTFESAVAVATGGGCTRLDSGDVNGDGYPDLVVGMFEQVGVLINDQAGGFLPLMSTAVVGSVRDLVLDDLDGDGDLDIALGHTLTGEVEVLTNDGSGVFAVTETRVIGESTQSIGSGDIDGDGDQDLVVITRHDDSLFYAISVMLNDGGGSFGNVVRYTALFIRQSVAVQDLDGDGFSDVVGVLSTSDLVAVVRGSETGVLGTEAEYLTPDSIWGLSSSDVDEQLGPDLVWASPLTNEIGVLLNTGNGTFGEQQLIPVLGRPHSVVVADVDGFGADDIVAVCKSSDDLKLLVGNGTGAFSLLGEFDVGDAPVAAAAGDLDGDQDLDLVVVNSGDDTISVLINLGFWSYAPAVSYDVGSEPIDVVIADIDGIGGLDVIVANEMSASLGILTGIGDGTLNAEVRIDTGFRPYAVAAGDLNNDGIVDLVNPDLFDHTVSVHLGVGNGTFMPRVAYPTPNTPRSVSFQDMDLDGYADLVMTTSTISAMILRNLGDGSLGSAVQYNASSGARNAIGKDINGDGLADLVSSDFGPDARILVRLSQSGDDACPADLNQDGALDFFDISEFLTNQIDFNGDEVFDFFDISAFLGAYSEGCP